MTFTGCSLSEAIDAASLHPAQALGIDNERGSLQPGMLADVILLDMDLNVQATCDRAPCILAAASLPPPIITVWVLGVVGLGAQVSARPPCVEPLGG